VSLVCINNTGKLCAVSVRGAADPPDDSLAIHNGPLLLLIPYINTKLKRRRPHT